MLTGRLSIQMIWTFALSLVGLMFLVSPATGAAVDATISRSIAVSERGFTTGWSFSRLRGEAEVYFPVSDAIRSAELVLDIAQNKVTDSDRSFRVLADDTLIFAGDPNNLGERDQIRIPLDLSLTTKDFLRIRVQYSGASSDDICVDERASGDFFRILPTSRLTMEIDESAITSSDTILRLQPSLMTVVLSDKWRTAEQLAGALRAATVFGAERGAIKYFDGLLEQEKNWSTGLVSIEAATGGAIADRFTLQTKLLGGIPAIAISGGEPQAAMELLRGNWASVAGSESLSVKQVSYDPIEERSLSFASLGFDVRPFMSSHESHRDFAFDIAAVPVGRTIGSLTLLYTVAQDARAEGVTIAVYLNDILIGSQPVHNGGTGRFHADVPQGLISRNNLLRVQIFRPVVEGECLNSALSLPAQIHGGSHFNLVAKSVDAADFHDLRQSMQTEVEVFISESAILDIANFQGIAPIFASIVPPSAEIRIVDTILMESAAPFVHIGESPPEGSMPALAYDKGNVELGLPDGEIILAGGSLSELTSAQIIRVGERQGVWVRPSNGFRMYPGPDQPVLLDRGDVALLDSEGIVVVTSSSRTDLLDITYTERRDILAMLDRYRNWIVGAAWLFLTLIAVEALRRVYRTQRN